LNGDFIIIYLPGPYFVLLGSVMLFQPLSTAIQSPQIVLCSASLGSNHIVVISLSFCLVYSSIWTEGLQELT